jgi:4-coumarate--CoA ligase
LEESKKALDSEGFIKSGDIGYFDEDNCLYIVDRVKDYFKYKNYPIFPSEIEKYLEEINEIEASCVVGIYSEEQGTSLATAVVKLSEKVDEKFIVDFIASKLPITKQLHGGVFFVDKIPMTPSGKVQRRIVQEMIFKKL